MPLFLSTTLHRHLLERTHVMAELFAAPDWGVTTVAAIKARQFT
jgi:hypothetical protein